MTKFSLVLCTINNRKDIPKFIESLSCNIHEKKFEVELIVIDQNTLSIADLFSDIAERVTLKYFKVDFKGLSRARNYALKHVSGDIVCFPDDDCIYTQSLLKNIYELFSYNNHVDFISVNTKDPIAGEKALVKLPKSKTNISFKSKNCVSFTLFFRREVINAVGRFDQNMGVGAGTNYGAGEESDFVVRALSLGFKGLYYPDYYVLHPAKESHPVFDDIIKNRMLSYGGGYGYFLQKNFYRQGRFLSIKNIFGVFLRLIKSLHSKVEFLKSFYFTIGFLKGFFKK
ncbi:glycosyltransferase family 2 protein [Escherichia coli]|uniref:glycosyltransferase n=1 Tax=Escherichia coli TaxID=562 RepID=UPI0010AD24A3|nr:glycosyltransferase family A protein [Escherichia coli]EFF7478551.1 glycosyltransferase family 2 protein [Escherichia coli]EFN0616248.1 glycosyltransferase family 2 protein [Escherichia coli]TJF31647.1 glycosyltransferase family 2 protein [Escherichia coli]TJG18521.1 glycosyltransferase family 2 protein [Escherichia coli]HAG6477601.1 glycosyltransferase family 2 protein [Escherichia coli]